MKEIQSQVFGYTILLDEDEEKFIELKTLIEKYPVNAFGIVNKLLNERNLSLTLGVIK